MQRRRQFLHGGLLQKTIALIFLSLLLVSGDQKEEKVKVVFGTNNSHLPPNVQEKQQQNQKQKQSLSGVCDDSGVNLHLSFQNFGVLLGLSILVFLYYFLCPTVYICKSLNI
ncbi:hypothetical protein WN944_007757 [Citrus x changshan-huyou]|uniref:Transmembrane protein n=1 Tax=Citrus x changshan-huyou TaxID=2935761 RepID=A0AAP0MRE6_9ROSI